MAMFFQGDKVEVCSKEEGFLGSYYQAKILSPLNDNTLYRVQYKNLVEEEDQTRPLVEIVSADEVFHYLDSVDAFDNDGWWVGKITGRQDLNIGFILKLPR
ncbi:protein AGENET DOMAIN (AGD)-CONTAINING P1-like [Gossypium arboreum]|uniref:protein AGENET DOMAIN (AGD)-CONTAINING P1-like n=1 Tax=Gossypium arboreum TaxID=29729 RepID=UPI0022F17134|nr:protein AGENET DOMAIN (AGD)-CONTAINING P1-like [Gossypium arboreum]